MRGLFSIGLFTLKWPTRLQPKAFHWASPDIAMLIAPFFVHPPTSPVSKDIARCDIMKLKVSECMCYWLIKG